MNPTEVGTVQDVPVLTVHGDIDLRTVAALRASVTEVLADEPDRAVIDLSDVTFLDSAGLKVFDEILRRTGEWGGRVALVCPQPHLVRLFEITGLDTRFPLHASLGDAVAPGE